AVQEKERRRREGCKHGAECSRPRCQKWHTFDLVFSQPNGRPLHDNIRLRDLKPLCTKLGLPYHRAFHNFRHAHGSYLPQCGVSIKVVQERLGHSTAAFTLSRYVHVLRVMEEQAARAASEMLKCSGYRLLILC